jgi:hypothetical protein
MPEMPHLNRPMLSNVVPQHVLPEWRRDPQHGNFPDRWEPVTGLPVPFLVTQPLSASRLPAFAEREDGWPFLCSCAIPGIEVFRHLWPTVRTKPAIEKPLGQAPLSSYFFPAPMARWSLIAESELLPGQPTYRDSICHRCSSDKPSPRIVDMYMPLKFLELGVLRVRGQMEWTADCPPEVRALIAEMMGGVKSKAAPVLAPDGNRKIQPVSAEDRLTDLVRSRLWADFNLGRREWLRETALFRIVSELFPSQVVRKDVWPEWLEGLSLDIYIPDMKLAVDYRAGMAVGAEYPNALARPGTAAQKAKLCEEHGVRLVVVLDSDRLSHERIRQLLTTND